MSEDNWSAEYKQSVVNELDELRELLTECQHGNDKLREEAAAQRKRNDDLVRHFNDMERLLESLTPGGSEFAADPEACAAWVRARLGSVGKLALERNRLREAGKALADSYQDGAKFVAKCAADTGSVLAQRALDRMEAAQHQWQEASDGDK